MKGKADRAYADARPSALRALIFNRIVARLRINREKSRQDFSEITARLSLNANCNSQKQQVVLADATMKILQRSSHIETKGDFIT